VISTIAFECHRSADEDDIKGRHGEREGKREGKRGRKDHDGDDGVRHPCVVQATDGEGAMNPDREQAILTGRAARTSSWAFGEAGFARPPCRASRSSPSL
jgi:hypothetical protein